MQLLLSDDLTTIEILAKVFKDHHAELASTLIHIFCQYDRVVPILTACLKKSIDKEGKSKTVTPIPLLSQFLLKKKYTCVSYITTCISLTLAVNTSTLFRASTLSTMLMDQFMKLTASQYLHSILKEPIMKVMSATEPCEVCEQL